jgi:hypothetical protein
VHEWHLRFAHQYGLDAHRMREFSMTVARHFGAASGRIRHVAWRKLITSPS